MCSQSVSVKPPKAPTVLESSSDCSRNEDFFAFAKSIGAGQKVLLFSQRVSLKAPPPKAASVLELRLDCVKDRSVFLCVHGVLVEPAEGGHCSQIDFRRCAGQ